MTNLPIACSFFALCFTASGCLTDDSEHPDTLDVEDDKADGSSTAAGDPLAMKHALHLHDFDGQPFLLVMIQRDGIKAQLDDDYTTTYEIASWSTVRPGIQSFDSKIVRKIAYSFASDTGMHDLVDRVKGKSFTPDTITGIVAHTSPRPRDVFAVAQVLAMTSGAGTLVTIDERNYYYNYGYKSGEAEDDVQSGRSFGASLGHRANDASDVFYLRELAKLLTTAEATSFYRVMFDVLTRTHVAGYADLSILGQTVETDFLAIYTAESDRHIMSDLYAHSWENDLAEVSMVSTWGTTVGKVMKDGHIVDGDPEDYWAMSTVSNRSGIGLTRWDRRALQRLITAYERAHHPELVEAIERITGSTTDVFHRVMTYLNDPRFLDDEAALKAIPAEQLTQAMVAFLAQVRVDAADMLTTPEFSHLMQ